ncbi:hypothetical protein [Bacillus pumilus]
MTDEIKARDNVGRYNDFKGGSIYCHPNSENKMPLPLSSNPSDF